MATDYSHRFHAGNVGDVWKHCVLSEILRHVARTVRVHYLDTHAGEGGYALAPTGEWTEGLGRLREDPIEESGERPVARYLDLVARLGGEPRRSYPGSPAIAAAVLGADATMCLWERDPAAYEVLGRRFGQDRRVRAVCTDGLSALPTAAREAEAASGEVVVLVDPSYATKDEWTAVPDALAAAVRVTARARFILWYPVKSLTRPNAMFARLETSGIGGTAVEVITTALEHQRNRLNGSGVVLVRPPAGGLEVVAAAAPVIAARCATRAGVWSTRMRTWVGRPLA